MNNLSAIYNLNCEIQKVLDIENSFQTIQLLLSEEISVALEKTRGKLGEYLSEFPYLSLLDRVIFANNNVPCRLTAYTVSILCLSGGKFIQQH